jgi:predicted nucleotidyltransferase
VSAVRPGRKATPDDLPTTLSEMVAAVEGAAVDYVLIGGLAVTIHGRPRHSLDIDFFVRPEDAQRALDAAAEAGFETNPINPHWIYKAFKHGVQVDVIFKVRGDIYLDEEMLRRSARHPLKGCDARIVPPEDLLVIKALAHDEDTPRHWHDALSILPRRELDWDYVVRRAAKGPRRVLSLLHYAGSLGLLVPASAVRELSATVFAVEGGAGDGP